jgi:hypothetical protein
VKRGGRLERKTPLAAKKPMGRGKGLARGPGPARTVKKRTPPKATGPTAEQRAAIIARDRGRCMRCGDRTSQIQHRWPRGRGGDNRLSNLILMCGSGTTGCHGWAETQQRRAATDQGWFVKTGEDPAVKPVFTRHGWIVLDDAGAYRAVDAA